MEAENEAPIEGAGEQQKASLFPIFPVSSDPSFPKTTSSSAPQWLSNASFTPSLSSIPGPTTSPYTPTFKESDGSDADEVPPSKPHTYDLLVSSSSSDHDTDRDKGRAPKKKKRKRKRSRQRAEDPSRKSGVRMWAGSETKPAKDYYIDSHGDRDNLAFGSLYRMDIARYNLHHPLNSTGVYMEILYHWKQRNSALDVDGDVDALDCKFRGGRYFSMKYSTLERHKDLKRVRVAGAAKYAIRPGEFIPLIELQSSHEHGHSESLMKAEIVESWEDEVLRRTKEFNRMSRENPHDEKVWIAFAEFQDKVASMQRQKAARLQTLEKKISILEKAVELNPDNEDLLLYLLKAYRSRDSSDILMERWENILRQHSGSFKLWKEFLHVCQGEFSRFRVSDMRKIYAHAIQAVSAACSKLYRQVCQTGKLHSADPDFIQLELGLLDVFISLCRFEWQTGHQELATGLFQAEIEYSLFCPSLLLTEQSKQKLFGHFWNGNGARVGEDGALGWSLWLEQEEGNRQKVITEDSSQENEVGGWTGWMEPLSRKSESSIVPEISLEDVVTDEDYREDLETENIKQEDEDVESLLKKLGISTDAEADIEVKDPSTWNRWSEEESSRDFEQWMPVRENSGREGHEQLSRVVLFEDVSEYLFPLRSEEARFCLVTQFIDFFGGKISQRLCTNSPSWIDSTLSLEELPFSILEDLRKVHEVVTRTESSSNHLNIEVLLGHSDDISRRTEIMKFLRNAILLCLNAFPRNYILEEALLVAEELFTTQMKSCACSVTPSRALAKLLLKNDRQDLLLCGVYARTEAAFGHIDLARKVFDMALASIEGLPLDLRGNAPLLYFWYAEMELSTCSTNHNSELSAQRAIHILSCLGSGVNYAPFKCQPSPLQLLRAHQGFKEQIRKLRSAWAHGVINDQSIALICSAALFENLTSGWNACVAVFEEAFSMTLPGRRSQSSLLESLFVYYIRMLHKHLNHLKLAKAWKTILQGLLIYPYKPELFAAFTEVGSLYTVPNKLRQIFDEYCNKKPSVIVWLFALSFELGKARSQHRVHGLFERALSDDCLHKSVILWRCYLAYEMQITHNPSAARRVFFRAIHACPWSKKLWLDGFLKLHNVLTAKELSDLQEVMREKELHLRTDIYEILLQNEINV